MLVLVNREPVAAIPMASVRSVPAMAPGGMRHRAKARIAVSKGVASKPFARRIRPAALKGHPTKWSNAMA